MANNDEWVSIGKDDDGWESIGVPDTPKPSKLESGLRGLAQGASMGFADELTGAGESALGSLGFVPDKTYAQARDESRAAYQAAQKANPGTYTTGQVGGALATTLIPGLNIAKGAGLAETALTGAAQGGLTALGSSESQDVPQLALDTLKGAGVGALAGGLAHGVGKAVDTLAPKAASAVEGAQKFMTEKGNNVLDTLGSIADVGSLAYGTVTDDWKPAAAIAGGRRLASAPAAKLAGLAMDKLPDILRATPEAFGKYAQPLLNAMQRGGTSLGAAHYVLQSSDPEYRKMLDSMQDSK